MDELTPADICGYCNEPITGVVITNVITLGGPDPDAPLVYGSRYHLHNAAIAGIAAPQRHPAIN